MVSYVGLVQTLCTSTIDRHILFQLNYSPVAPQNLFTRAFFELDYRLGGVHLFSGVPGPKRDFRQVICSRKKRKVLILLSSFSLVYWTPQTVVARQQNPYYATFTTRNPPAPHPLRLPMTPMSLGRLPSMCLLSK